MPVAPALFDYEFTIWPEDHDRDSVFEVFRLITPRTSLTMTEGEFWEFLCQLHGSGLTAVEATKVPHRDHGKGNPRERRHAA
jgi:hypothetical protein